MLKRAKIKVESGGATEILHIQLLATLIENLFLMFSLRYGQDDKYAKIAPPLPEGRCHAVTEGGTRKCDSFQCIVYKK